MQMAGRVGLMTLAAVLAVIRRLSQLPSFVRGPCRGHLTYREEYICSLLCSVQDAVAGTHSGRHMRKPGSQRCPGT